MARLRTLKPSFFTNDELAELSPLHRLFFQGLWCHADKAGRLEDRPRRLKSEILPFDDCDAEEILSDLAGAGFIARYEAGGRHYIAIPKFAKHQKPHPREAESEIPAPDGAPLQPAQRSVYFIQAGEDGPIKIGMASNVTSRLDGLQTAHPQRLRLLGTRPWKSGLESELHQLFAADRLNGEWFKPSKELLRYIGPGLSMPGHGLAGQEDESRLAEPGCLGDIGLGDIGLGGCGKEKQPPPLPPGQVEPPVSKPDTWLGQDFWRWAQHKRGEVGFLPERPPNHSKLSSWWSSARMAVSDMEALKEAYYRFAEDKFWQEKKDPPLPFGGFMSQWQKYVPRLEALHA